MEFASKPKVFGSPNQPLLDAALPLDHCEGDPNSDSIEFTMSAMYELEILDKLKSPGEFAQSDSSFCLYHSHVLWSYKHRTTRHNDGTFGMSLVGIGPNLVEPSGNEFAALYKPQQQPPDLLAATISFEKVFQGEEIATFEFERAGNDVWASTKHFTREELAAFGDPALIYFTMRIIVARSYFDLPKLLKDPATPATGYTKKTVECILRGEKPDGWDFWIRVGREDDDSSLPLNYYVHSTTFARVSQSFQAMKRQNPSNSCCMPKLAPEDMPVIISLIYGVPVPLPTTMHRMRELLANAGTICDNDVFARLFPQWERTICEQALALDKSDPRSFAPLIRLLLFSLSLAVPLPSARTATMAVFAEMALLHKTAGIHFDQHRIDHKSIIGRAFAAHNSAPSIVEGIVNVMFVLVASVRVVTKTGLATKKKDSEAPSSPISSPPRDLSTPTVVVVDDDDAVDNGNDTDASEESEDDAQCPIS